MRAEGEKLLAVPRPMAGMAFMLCNLTATQSKTYLGRASKLQWRPINKEAIESGRHSPPHRGHEAAEVAPVLDKGFEDGAVHVAIHRRRV